MQLHERPNTVFAGYRIPHPLKAEMVVKVQTTGQQPDLALNDALEDIKSEFIDLRNQAASEFARVAGEPQRYMMTPRR